MRALGYYYDVPHRFLPAKNAIANPPTWITSGPDTTPVRWGAYHGAPIRQLGVNRLNPQSWNAYQLQFE